MGAFNRKIVPAALALVLASVGSTALAGCDNKDANGQQGTGIENGQTGVENPGVEEPGGDDVREPEIGDESIEARREAWMNEEIERYETIGHEKIDGWKVDPEDPNAYLIWGERENGRSFMDGDKFPPELQLRAQ
jgi:hypothetical protein